MSINKLYSRKRPLLRNLLQSLSLSPILHQFRVSKQAIISLQGMAESKKACGHCRLSRYQMALGSTHPVLSFLTIFPFFAGILAFLSPGLEKYLMRATASYSYEGLGALAIFFVLSCHNCRRPSSRLSSSLHF